MKLFLTITLIVSLTVVTTLAKNPMHGDSYQALSAQQKYSQNMDKLNKKNDNGDFYSLRLMELFIQDNNQSFDVTADDMPGQGPFDIRTRPKLIHTVGLTAGCEFVSTGDHPYTGMFKGSDFGIVRLSAARQPTGESFAPGFTFKLFRNQLPSSNIISMFSLVGQDTNSNPFAHDVTNHVPYFNQASHSKSERALLQNFLKVSDYPTMIGVSDSAKFDQLGNEEKDPQFPFRLVFHPSKEAHTAVPTDIDMGKNPLFFIDYVDGLQFETLFDVYAQATPNQDEFDLQKIGEIKMKTPFKPSKYGDEELFYQHTRFEEDLKYYPEWSTPALEIMEKEEKVAPLFIREDIPFN